MVLWLIILQNLIQVYVMKQTGYKNHVVGKVCEADGDLKSVVKRREAGVLYF